MGNVWRGQHDPTLLENGNMLLFNKQSGTRTLKHGKLKSEIMKFNPLNHELTWRYSGTKESPFASRALGAAQRLPKGNTLITESNLGRVFEVTKNGEIVWEFNSPHLAGKNDKFVAVIPDMYRLLENFPLDFINPSS